MLYFLDIVIKIAAFLSIMFALFALYAVSEGIECIGYCDTNEFIIERTK